MDSTGGSYMQQPITSSEAVRRCMNVPINGSLSSHHNAIVPRPPYASGRPSSAPTRRCTYSYKTSLNDVHRSPMYNRYTQESQVSRFAPFRARKTEAFVNSSLGYPVSDMGPSTPLPNYSPLNDPHLVEYFERRFGTLQLDSLRRQRRQLSSAGSRRSSSTLGFHRGSGGKGAPGDILYKVFVTTGSEKGATTDAKVYIKMNGTKGKMPKTRLTKKAGSVKENKAVSFRFSRGTTHNFKIRGPNIGDIKSIHMEHNGTKKEDGWFLEKVKIVNTKNKKVWIFHCNQWLSYYHTDGKTSRELFPQVSSKTEYEIVTVTGDKHGAGTDAHVFVKLFGKSGVTGKIQLRSNTKYTFKRNSSNTFVVPSHCVGPLTKLRIEHDDTGIGSGWFLERVVVTDLHNPKWKYYFPCGMWLARDEGDGSISRDLIGSRDPMAIRKAAKYKVTVYTGNKKGAGTDANVYITIFGDIGDSGERPLKQPRKNNFERGKKDEFVVECGRLGALQRVRVGHDNSGFGPGWFLDKIIIDDVEMGTVYEFPCSRWLARDEDDGQISRDLLHGVGPMAAAPGTPYIITVTTGDKPSAGTDARVYVELFGGKKGIETSGKIWLDDGKFERNMTDLFNISIAELLSPLDHIVVGHDNSGAAPGWFLDSVSVYCPSAGYEQFFPCNKWLAKDEHDNVIQRTLYEQMARRKKREKKVTWYVWVKTSDISNAGTDSNVAMVMYGEKGKTDEHPLENKGDSFEQGKMDQFKLDMTDVGKPYKIRIEHDNKGMFAGWHLEKVEMECMATKERYIFPCDKWLATDEEDGETVREMAAEGPGIKKPLPLVKYLVEVHTGKRQYAGTDANVYLNIFGELGDTGKRWLRKSKNNINKFEKAKVDTFEIEAVNLKKINKIRVGHDGTGPGSGWFLDKIVIKQIGSSKYDTTFECNRWLAEDEDDGLIEREITASGSQMLSTTRYIINVKTGDVRGAGTDANVTMKIFGSKGDTGVMALKSSDSSSNKFERNRTDVFTKDATDIGKIKYIRIGHDGTKIGSGWFLDNITVDIPSRGEHYFFAAHRWLAKDEEDQQLEIELEPSSTEKREKTIPYEVTIWTSEKRSAGTDANVFLQMYGEKGKKTQEIKLRNKTDNFEKGQMDKFKVEEADIGRIQKVRIGHDGGGRFAGWHMEKMLIQRRPLAGTKKKRRSPSETERRKSLLSSSRDEEDSDSTGYSPPSTPKKRKRRPGHKSSLERVDELDEDIYDGDETEDYWFFVDKWFAKGEDDNQIVRELIPTDEQGRPLKGSLKEVEYTVKIYTGDILGAGTDANVYVNLYGENGDSGERHMKDSNNTNKFEKNKEDIFKIRAIDLGRLVKLKIRHDNKGGGAAWFLDRVEVEDPDHRRSYFFPCQRWLAVNEDDGQISRDLVPVDQSLKRKLSRRDSTAIRDEIALETKAAMTTYHVKVTTGNVWGAGTDANIYVILFGEEDSTGKMFLKSSLTNKNKFERGKMDEFILECVKIGELKKIKIGHDNAGGGAAWHLDNVVIDCPSLGRRWTFPCNRWLGEKEDDGAIERELFPQELATQEYVPCIPYEITTYTSDKSGASTDADVFVVLYGKDTCTEKKSLCHSKRERKEKFKRGATDKFVVELEDVGPTIEKLRIGHDGSGFGAGWHLNKVEVRRLHVSGRGKQQGSITYEFPCDRWLASNEEDGAIVRELVPAKATKEVVGRDGEVKQVDQKLRDKLQAKKYIVNVFTGSEKGGGTDANVFLTIFGEKGDTGERKLANSETHRDKFERNQHDRFQLEAGDLGRIHKIYIRHDNSMISPAWYLDRVEITDPADNQNYIFHCERWLAKNKGDGKIERHLYVKGYDGEMSSTGTLRSARIGSMTSLDSVRSSDPFSKSPRLSRKQLANMSSMEEIPEGPTIPYTVKVTTGNGEDNGTESNVWVRIIGPKKVHTGRLFLELAQKESFLPGSVETFSLEAIDVDEVRKIEVGHDGVAPGTGWFLKEVEVDVPTKGKHFHFTTSCWLARDKDDGKTSRIFSVDDGQSSMTSYKPMIPYEVTVHTGDVSEAGTDCKISMTVYGQKGASSPFELPKNEERFERARTDLIKMEIDDVAPLKKLRVSIEPKAGRQSWYLEKASELLKKNVRKGDQKIELRNMETGVLTVFTYKDWLGKEKGKGDGRLSVDLPATERGKSVISKTNYKITVKTSDVRGAGTNANVYVIIFGAHGDSGDLHLKQSETNKNPFEQAKEDVFLFKNLLSLGELTKLRVWHDDKGFGSSWHLGSIEIEDMSTHKTYMFVCDRWLSKSEDDKQIIRELTCSNNLTSDSGSSKDKVVYDIEITTTDKKEGGTIHNGWLILEGSRKTSKAFIMENSAKNKILRKGQTDNFKFVTPKLGKLECCILGAFTRDDRPPPTGEGKDAYWHCHEVVVTNTTDGEKYHFPCKSWIPITPKVSKSSGKQLDVGKVEEGQVARTRDLAPVKYEVIVHTGDVKGSGTNANVSINIFGTNGDTGKRPLKQKFRDLFERNQIDKFQIEALDLGELRKIQIEHDNSGFRPGWFLDYVHIVNLATNVTTKFPCDKWFDKEKGDGEISREIYARSD